MTLETLYGMVIFFLGLIFGSFYNVVGYRVPNKMSISFPSSHCPNCNHKLKFYELIPVISYIFLRGKCKECKKRVSFIYPFFELLTGTMFLLSYLVYGINIYFVICITFISILIIISISDIRYFIIPDEVLISGVILIIFEYVFIAFNDGSILKDVLYPILNGMAAFALLYLFKVLGDFLFKKESLGGGDIKLLFLVGLVLGFDMSIVTIFIASFIALPLSMLTLIKKDSNVLPFGPYLSLAATIIMLLQLDLNFILEIFTN